MQPGWGSTAHPSALCILHHPAASSAAPGPGQHDEQMDAGFVPAATETPSGSRTAFSGAGGTHTQKTQGSPTRGWTDHAVFDITLLPAESPGSSVLPLTRFLSFLVVIGHITWMLHKKGFTCIFKPLEEATYKQKHTLQLVKQRCCL